MAYHDITNPVFNDQLRKYEITDPVHADVYNAVEHQLINNDVALKGKIEEVGEFATPPEVKVVIDDTIPDIPSGGGDIPEEDFATDEEVQEVIDDIW